MNQVSGKIIAKLPVVTGEKDGRIWVRSGLVIQTSERGEFLAIECTGEDNANLIASLSINTAVMASYFVTSRMYGDKWFTTARLLNLLVAQRPSAQLDAPQSAQQAQPQAPIASQQSPSQVTIASQQSQPQAYQVRMSNENNNNLW